MGNFSCPVITPAIQEIYAEIRRLYPEGSSSVNLDVKRVATWVDMYASANNIPIDNVTKKDAKAVVNHAEKCLNMDGKSFKKVEASTVNSNELLGPETKINIYAGTNENADLSNFAERPLNFGKTTAYSLPEGSKVGAFKSKYPIYHIGKSTYSTKQNPESGDSFVFDGLSDLFSGRRFKTVEGAFQAAKLVFTHPKGNGAKGNKYWQPKEYTQRENSIDGVYYNTANVFVLTDEGEQLLQKFQEASGAQARSLGRQIEGLDRQEWDANSSKIMKAVIGRSFEANPQALQRLLATGNATLTHTQDKGKWGKEFPKLLMEVRAELGGMRIADANNTINSEENRSINEDEIFSTISITQNASGRLGTMDKKDEEAFKAAKATLRDPQSTAEQIQQAKKALKDIYDRKNKEIQTIFKTVTDKTGATFSLEEAAGSWLGGEEYSFKIKVSAPNQKAYDKTMQMISYVAEGARQDAYIENLGEVDDSEVTSESLLAKEHTPFIHISFTRDLSQQEIAAVQNLFNSKNSDEVPLDATVTKNEIVFALPVWKLGDNPTQEAYKDLYNKWYNKLKETYNNGKERELKGLVGESFRRRYEKSRFHQADNAYSEEKERGYSSDRDNNFPQGGVSEQEGQAIKSYVEKVVGLEQPSPLFEQFKKDVNLLAGYYEGGGRRLSDDLPGISSELDYKLANYFMDDKELSIDDYRELWKLIEFYDENGERTFRERKAPSSPSPSPASGSSSLTDSAVGFDAAEAKAESDRLKQQRAERIQAEANKPKPERPKSVSYESALDVKDSPIAQFKRTFSPQQIKDRGAMISDMFSDVIDEALWDEIDNLLDIIDDDNSTEEQRTEAKQRLKAIKDPVKGRQLIAQEIGIPVIIDAIKQRIQDNMDSAPEDKKQLWENILEYNPDFYGDGSKTVYDAFCMLFNSQASLDIEEREGIRIIGLKFNGKTASEEETEKQDDGDDEVGHIVSGTDGWMFQVRFTDPFSSLSKKVRSMLYEVARPESEKDDLGRTRYYPMGQIYATLLTYLSRNVETADDFLQVVKDFEELPETLRGSWTTIKDQEDLNYRYPNGYPVFPALENLSKAHPWVSQIIDRLTDDYLEPESNTNSRYPSTGGAMASQMYRIVQRFIPYGKIQIGTNPKTGKPYFNVTPLNYEMEDKVQYDKLEANYNNRMILTEHSAYNSDGTINKENAQWLKKEIGDVVNQLDRRDFREIPELLEYDQNHPDEDNILSSEDVEEYNSIIDRARHILQSFGIDATQDSVVSYLMMGENGSELRKIISDLDYVADRILKVDDARIPTFNYIIDLENPYKEPVWKHFFDGRGMITDASYMQSFYDSASKKTKYSYSADNYLMKTFRGVCMGSKEKRQRYINEHFGKFEWFKNQNTGEWRNKWLEFWYNYDGELKEIPYKNIDNITEYSDDGTAVVRPYSKWIKDDIWQVQERSYEADSKKSTAFYLAPIFSDSPMSMTVMGPRMSMEELLFGYTGSNNIHHQGALVQLVNQELWRIQYVQERAKAIKEGRLKEIANFDGKRGLQFCFLPELNDYTFDADESRGYPEESFLDRMIHMKKDRVTSKEIEALQIQAITDILNAKMYEYMHDNSKHYEKEPISPEQYYNMVYANAAIIQMTTVDLAFYKSYDDFQKRFKEVYAGGIQLNTNSKYGKKTENVVILSDDIITSPSYNKVAKAIDSSKNLNQKDKDDIKALFKKVNLADAQAIRAMHSFRSVLDMMGNWTDEMEQALQRFKDGIWDRVDFDTIYQIIKPFVYTVIERNDGKGGSILVPQQHKNSEICALMMYDLIANSLDNSPVYKALSRFMDENTDANGEHLIDMIQFESAGKVGNQGVVNISYNPEKVIDLISRSEVEEIGKDFVFYPAEDEKGNYIPLTVENADAHYNALKEQLDKELAEKRITQDTYNELIQSIRPTEEEIISMLEQATLITNPDGTKSINMEVVHTIPFDNYYQQQPTPEHYQDEEIMVGSQSRNISVADLPEDFEMTLKGKKGSKTFKGKDAIIDFYYELMNENLIEDFFGKGNKKGLKGIFASKKDLADAVTDIVRGNPKYGADFAEALQLDDDGNYVLNPNSPTVFTMMQEIVTSFFKNRITKQKINGAALIQAAGIGLDEDLRLQFDEDGKLKGIECYMPITSKKLFEPLLKTDKDGNKYFDINSLPENMREAIGYRIPTENKSSMAPLIIKGFTPLQNGSAIILPAEITTIAGSDFDVDKMYVMLSSFTVITHDKRKAFEAYTKEEHANAQEMINALGKANIEDLEVDEIGENFAEWFKIHGDDYLLDTPKIKKIEYDFSKTPKENGRKARNNMIIQLMYGILTSKEGTEQVLNPQGFRDVKRAAKIARILTDTSLLDQLIENTSSAAPGMIPSAETIVSEFLDIVQQRYPDQYEDYKRAVLKMPTEEIQAAYIKAITAGSNKEAINLLLNASTDDLEDFIDRYSTPESPAYPQTFAKVHARNMAGVNQLGIYAVQGSMAAKYQRATVRLTEKQQFTINGRRVTNVDMSEGGKRLKNVGQMIGASADNGKDPNLSDMGSTEKTAPIIGYMLRLGLSPLEAALVINQEYMKNSGYSSKKEKYWKDMLGKNLLAFPVENVTTDMLIKNLISPFELSEDEKKSIAGMCYRILCQKEAQEYLTRISRADSVNGAMQNSYAKARMLQYRVDLFQAKMGQDKTFPFERIKEAVSNTAIDVSAPEDVIREQLKGQRMGLLHGMYALGVNSFQNLVAPYFFGARKWFDDRIVKPILYNLGEVKANRDGEKIIDNIYKSYITFMLSGSDLFGNEEDASMKSKRDYYLETFPSDYQKILQENEDIKDLLSTVLQVKNFGSRKRVILQDVGSLTKGQKQDVQRRFEDLLYSPNPVAQKLAKDLLIYSYFDNGLQFTHDSFSHLFTTGFLTKFPTYTDTLNRLEKEISQEKEENFIAQFLLTYPEAAYKVDDIIDKDKNIDPDGNIKIDLNDKNMYKYMVNEVMSPNPRSEINVYPYISYEGEIYMLDKEIPGGPVYRKVEGYDTHSRLPLFSVEMSVSKMAQEFPVENESQQETPSLGEDDRIPAAHNEGEGNPNVAPDSMYTSFEGMDDSFEFADYADASRAEEKSPSEQYDDEGKGELQDPLC